MSSRTTRSQSRQAKEPASIPAIIDLTTDDASSLVVDSPAPIVEPKAAQKPLHHLTPTQLARRLLKLSPSDRALLLSKQIKLREPTAQVPVFIASQRKAKTTGLAEAAAATLVLAQEAAGTAICVSSSGLLLTCAHCIAETRSDYDLKALHWLLFANGDIVQAKCVSWDQKRDLALLQVDASTQPELFPFIRIAEVAPKSGAKLLCIGHPGSEDLEADTSGIETGYDVLHISEGKYRGMQPGQDVEDNSEIGALRHDCFTYWGHSGAPLVDFKTGGLVGLHSSWDDETGMRRGVGLLAIQAFLKGEGVEIGR